MLSLKIISVGKLKEAYWRSAQEEYLKRLQAFVKIDILELKEEAFSQKDNFAIIKQKEAKKILEKIPANSFIVALDKGGMKVNSKELAEYLEKLQNTQISNITVVIGGPLGLDESVKQRANALVSLSAMTFTHQMSRIILLEQLYRAFMINENRPYHY